MSQIWWYTLFIPAFGRQRQVCLCEFQASLVCKVSFLLQKETVLKNQERKKTNAVNFHDVNLEAIVFIFLGYYKTSASVLTERLRVLFAAVGWICNEDTWRSIN